MSDSIHIGYKCPACKGSLEKRLTNENSFEAYFCLACQNSYPIIRSIPRFADPDGFSDSFGFQWNYFSQTQLDSANGQNISKERINATTGWPPRLKGEKILEAGSGAGRFTEILLKTGADVYSFDYSNAVEANYQNNRQHTNLHLFQGDIYNMPFGKNIFDKVISLGVLQHTPDPRKAFSALAEVVKEDGEIIIDIYKKTARALCQWKYLLRPLTRRMNKKLLFCLIRLIVPVLLPFSLLMGKVAGRIGIRLFPIVSYPDLQLTYRQHMEWSVLDTFDMYAPLYDKPQTLEQVKSWLEEAGFVSITVEYGPNGIVAKGRKRPNLCAV